MNRAPQNNSGRRRLAAAVAALVLLALAARADNPNSIIYSKHNLSVSGSGTVHAVTELDVCIFCHTPHAASAADGAIGAWFAQAIKPLTEAFSHFVSMTLSETEYQLRDPHAKL